MFWVTVVTSHQNQGVLEFFLNNCVIENVINHVISLKLFLIQL